MQSVVALSANSTILSAELSVSLGRLVTLKFTCLLPQLLFTYEGQLCRAVHVVEAAISVHCPTILSWIGCVTTKIIGLTRAGPTVEASRTQRLICNKRSMAIGGCKGHSK